MVCDHIRSGRHYYISGPPDNTGYLALYFHNAFLPGFVSLLVNNLSLILTTGILFIAADIFYSFHFPLACRVRF